jgi:hypothetical protein
MNNMDNNKAINGYIKYALDFAENVLKNRNYTEVQLDEIRAIVLYGLDCGKEKMNIEDAIKYYEREN